MRGGVQRILLAHCGVGSDPSVQDAADAAGTRGWGAASNRSMAFFTSARRRTL